VAKGKTHQTGSRKSLFNNPARDSKKKKIVRKIQTNCSDENGGETFCLVCMDRYSESLAREKWVQCTQCQMWANVKCTAGVSWGYICCNCKSDVSDKISEVLWTYISVLSIIFQCNL
jgi:DNA-directed RNA polymerase subunit RPC12/RpoP